MASLFRGQDLSHEVRSADLGSDWYFAIFAVMAASVVAFSILLIRAPHGERALHYLSLGTVAIASIAYLSMASSNSTRLQEFSQYSIKYGRQVFVARYIDWFITTPLLLVDLMVLAGSPWGTIFFTVLVDEVMIIAGLYGALAESYSYIPFGFGCLCYLYIAYTLIWKARKSARELGTDVYRLYVGVAIWTAAVWTLYPVVWGLSEIGNLTSKESEAVFYGILDLLAKPVCGLWILMGKSSITRERMSEVKRQAMLDEKSSNYTTEPRKTLEDVQFIRQLQG